MDGKKEEKHTKYKGLKIALIYGQSIEGCGVSRGGVEVELWAEKTGAIAHTYALNEKKYSRANAHNFKHLKYFSKKEIKQTAQYINDNYDIVIFNNYPHNKFTHDILKSFYYDFFEVIQKPIKAVYIHEIHRGEIDKKGYLVPMLVNSDLVFHFDIDTWFSKIVHELGFQQIGDRLNKYTLWMNFDELDTYRQVYLNNKKKGLVSVTRWSSLKNVRRSIDIMAHLQELEPSWKCSIHGIERSIGAKFDILDYPKTIYVNPNGKKDNEEKGEVHVYGPVTRNEGLDIVGSCLFSSSFFSLPRKPENYGNRAEYSQIEIIGVGTIPVFDKHWAENNKLNDGRKYIDIPYSAVYTNGSNTREIAEKLIEISKDPKEIQKYLDTSYNLVKSEFDAEVVIPKAIDLIQSKGKNKNQMSVYEVCDTFGNKDFADEIKKLEDGGKLPVLGIGEFETLDVFYLEGAKQVHVKKIKRPRKNKNVKPLF